jgi:membrane dipeptidase
MTVRTIAGVLVLFGLALAGSASAAHAAQPAAGAPTALPAIIDGHADFAIHYAKKDWAAADNDIERSLPGQSDVPRWRAGGINGMLATVGSDLGPGSAGHFPRVLVSLDWFDALIASHGRALSKALTAADFEAADRDGRIALMPALEGGDQIDGSLENLRTAYARGVRSMGIVYDHHNDIGDGAMAMPSSTGVAAPSSGGLTPLGRRVVAEMNRLGMLIDLSHAAESTSLEVLRLSSVPVIFSHSGARALADTPRNLSDQVLRALASNGGIVMVPLVPYLTTTEHWRWWLSGETEYARLADRFKEDSEAIDRGMAAWDTANPQPAVTVSQVADQVAYVARIVGIDHVGIGSDFDGMDSFVIPDLSDASRMRALFDELIRRGWNEGDLRKLARENFLRVVRAVQAQAAR